MKTPKLPTVPANDIFSALRDTPAGKSLRSSIRFSPYKQPHETISHWKKVLGPSAVIYHHMRFTYKVTHSFLTYELTHRPVIFTPKEQRMLLLAALIHDFGEAMIDDDDLGDIPYFLKKEEHEKKEIEIFEKVLHSLELDKKLKSEMKDSYHKIVVDKKNHLYDFFRVVEDSEYIMTALNVYGYRKKNRLRISKERILIGSVLSIALEDVMRVTHNYLSATRFLRLKASEITLMFNYSREEFQKSNDFTMKSKTADIERTWRLWQEFLKHKNFSRK